LGFGGDLKPGHREQSKKNQTVLNEPNTMNTKMYVGNLSFDTSESDLRALCEQNGLVTDIHLPIDRTTNRPRGFAFVTMETAEGMKSAISNMNGKPLGGRLLTVNEARPREERPAYSGGCGGGNKRERY
jgi:RNA recognition motif-containing protein